MYELIRGSILHRVNVVKLTLLTTYDKSNLSLQSKIFNYLLIYLKFLSIYNLIHKINQAMQYFDITYTIKRTNLNFKNLFFFLSHLLSSHTRSSAYWNVRTNHPVEGKYHIFFFNSDQLFNDLVCFKHLWNGIYIIRIPLYNDLLNPRRDLNGRICIDKIEKKKIQIKLGVKIIIHISFNLAVSFQYVGEAKGSKLSVRHNFALSGNSLHY